MLKLADENTLTLEPYDRIITKHHFILTLMSSGKSSTMNLRMAALADTIDKMYSLRALVAFALLSENLF